MIRKWLLVPVLSSFLFGSLQVLSANPARDKAHQLAQAAPQIHAEISNGVSSMEDCHGLFAAGCTASAKYDGYLSFLKNQRPSPLAHTNGVLVSSDFDQKESRLPGGLTSRNHADHANELADLDEGNIFTVIGLLYYAKKEGSEACNCQLTASNAVDWHMWVGFDGNHAQQVRNGEITTAASRKPLLQEAIVAEVTPHYRAELHPEWTLSKVTGVLGRQVKLVGQLMVDNDHLGGSDNCAASDANTGSCWRRTVWELHPVIRFYVCDSDSPCDENSSHWKNLKNSLGR